MRLISLTAEKALIKSVRAAYRKMARTASESDLLAVVYATGIITGADPMNERVVPDAKRIRQVIKSGLVTVDQETVAHATSRLRDAARTIQHRLVGAVKTAISDANSVFHRQRKVGQQKMDEVRKISFERVHALIDKALTDAQRDWGLAVDFAAHDTLEEAKATTIVKAVGADPLVWKKIYSDCCAFCRLFYTVDGVVPRVFNLSELVGNGTNIGKRAGKPSHEGDNATEWRPTLGPTHPRCRCQLQSLPVGASFGPDGQLRMGVALGRRTG